MRTLLVALACLLLAHTALAQALRLAVSRGPVSLPVYVAEARGLFAREGLGVEVLDCSSGRQCFQMLGEGRADLATAAELVVTLAGLDGSDAAIIATLSASSRHIKLVGRRSAGIQQPADLRGKRIATVAGTSAQYFLDSWLVYHEIDPQELSIQAMAPDKLVGAFQRREVDALAIWEPLASAAAAALGTDAQAMPSARVYTQHFSLVAARRTLAEHEAPTVKLLRALGAAQRFIAEQPDKARQILNARLLTDASAASLAEHDFRLGLAQSLVATMEAQARWAARLGHASATPKSGSVLRLIEPGPLRKVLPGSVSLVP